jgi:hypothetical protein
MGCDDRFVGRMVQMQSPREKNVFCGPRSCVEEIPEKDMSGEEVGKA